MKKLILNEKYENLIVPIIAIIGGILVGAIIMIMSGINPLVAYSQLLTGIFGGMYNIGEWLITSSLIILTGASVAFAYRAGLFNIGAEGQFIVGSMAAILVGLLIDLPTGIHAFVALGAGILAGALYGFIPGFLKAYFGVHEVVVTIMLNYIALYTTNYLINVFSTEDSSSKTEFIDSTASLSMPFLSEVFAGARMNWGIFVALLAIFIFWFIMEKTTLGYELKAVGYNFFAAKYAGIREKSRIIYTMMIAGSFAGAAGAIYSVGIFNYLTTASTFRNFGFDGIAVALLGAANPFGVLFSGLLIGGLKSGSKSMEGVPTEIISIIMALIILFTAMGYVIRLALKRQRKKLIAKGGK